MEKLKGKKEEGSVCTIKNPFEFDKRFSDYLEKLAELRRDGENTIIACKSENKDIKLNKQIDKQTKEKCIEKNNKAIEDAKVVKKENFDQVKAIILEASKLAEVEGKKYYECVKTEQTKKVVDAKKVYAEEKVQVAKEHDVRLAKIVEDNKIEADKLVLEKENKLTEASKKTTDEKELSEIKSSILKDYSFKSGEFKKDSDARLNSEKILFKSKKEEIKSNYNDIVSSAKNAKFTAYNDKYNYLSKLRNNKHSIPESFEHWHRNYAYQFKLSQFLISNALYFIIIGFFVVCIIASNGNLISGGNILGILSMSSTKLFFSLGVAGLILLAGTDLSIGRMTGLGASIACMIIGRAAYTSDLGFTIDTLGWSVGGKIIVALLACIVICVFFSAIAGFFSAKFKMHPFITTLSTQLLIFGIMMVMWKSTSAFNMNIDVKNMLAGESSINIIICAVIATIVMWFIWNKTKFGKNMYAVGGNAEAASVSGISVFGVTFMVFIMAGGLYGLGGFLEGVRTGTANANSGFGTELDAIAACVIGGISFSGGIGKIRGAVIGTLIFTGMTYCLTNLGLDQNIQYIFKGVIIMAAVCLDSLKYLKKK